MDKYVERERERDTQTVAITLSMRNKCFVARARDLFTATLCIEEIYSCVCVCFFAYFEYINNSDKYE